MIDVLSAINTELHSIGINYEFKIMNKAPPKYPYWIGDYVISGNVYEDGELDITFFLNGFTRKSYLEFEKEKTKIYRHFQDGITITKNNTVLSIQSGTTQNIDEEDAELKRCQIELIIKSWKGR